MNYLDGKLNGAQTWWYKSGNKDEERNYRKDIENGQRVKWFENGKKEWKHITKMKRDGLHTEWRWDNGKKHMEAHFKDGDLHGPYKDCVQMGFKQM